MRDRFDAAERRQRSLKWMLYAALTARWVLSGLLLYIVLNLDWSHGLSGVIRLIWEGTKP